MIREKISFLKETSGSVQLEHVEIDDFSTTQGFEHILIGNQQECSLNRSELKWYVFREDGIQVAVGFKRTAYEGGEEIPYDGREKYINKITFLTASAPVHSALLRRMIARAILEVNDNHLVLVVPEDEEIVTLFESLKFTRVNSGTSRKTYHIFSFNNKHNDLNQTDIALSRSREEYQARLSEHEVHYHEYLRDVFNFDIVSLVKQGWTIYRRDNQEFLFVMTAGTSSRFNQSAFKLDVFDMKNRVFVGYNDIYLPDGSDTAINDLPVKDLASELPGFASVFDDRYRCDIALPDKIRCSWLNGDGIWVQLEYRRAGIGQALERIAGDICKLACEHISGVQVCVNFDNPQAYYFHLKNGAVKTTENMYNLEYRLDDEKRPRIHILYGV